MSKPDHALCNGARNLTMQLTVTTLIFGLPSGQRTIQTRLTLPAVTLTLQELIAHKVLQEITEVAAHQRPGLSGEAYTPEELITAASPEALVPGTIDAEIARAQQAFVERAFMIVVNNHRVFDLEARLTLQPDLQVEFIKILPLVGG